MSTPYDPARLRAERFARLANETLRPVGAAGDGGSWGAFQQIFRHRQMLDLLIRRDLKSRYKDSSLGFLWTLIRPLTQLVIYYVVMGQFLGAARGIPDFAIYIFAGLTIYGLFSEVVLGGVNSVVSNSGLVKKIYLPREVFPLASVGAAIFNFGIQLVVLFTATVVLGTVPLHAELLYAIPATLLVLVYGTAFALLLAAVNVYLRDTQYLTEVVMMFLMWASPIVYGWTMVEDILGDGLAMEIYTNNPITLAVLGFHKAFWAAGDASQYPDDLLLRMAVATAIGLVLVYAFHHVFRRLQGNFAQEL
ncbi:ABC transporter permease [Microbacterium trichothecenolyticum]|uniref:ABC transporter permease n=1 Tax=Microbacterium trichothecenolyticum TaxID=69370 RepID=UPI001C6EC261|nr:ABC transporter permease [Microbacterium trichothecenolyticum]MBW9119458.1 ABC transporter permease [Microbacterium trichothecenolyticum]